VCVRFRGHERQGVWSLERYVPHPGPWAYMPYLGLRRRIPHIGFPRLLSHLPGIER